MAEVSREITLWWMSLDLSDDKSTLFQVMTWYRKAQAITRANVDADLCRHMASLGHNELSIKISYFSLPLSVLFFYLIFLMTNKLIWNAWNCIRQNNTS